ncbi:MAG: ribbon-helix-helix protein, CopG family [Thermoproteota archaeon]|jgi:predicted CopG family antitoxin|nr:ribbon-helix-helix protein, CopG family [Thermoproteota archaeon]
MTNKTTIQIDQDTLKILEKLKKERRVKSYSELIRQLINESKKIEKSEKGSLSKIPTFIREEYERVS